MNFLEFLAIVLLCILPIMIAIYMIPDDEKEDDSHEDA